MPAGRRRPTRTDVDREVLAAHAVALVDARGLDALSIRSLAAAVDLNPMSVYRHVPDKADLLLAVVQRVLDEAEVPAEASSDWEPVLRGTAAGLHAALSAHPHLLPLFAAPPGSVVLLHHLSVPVLSLALAGFDEVQAVHVCTALAALVLGAVQLEVGLDVATDDLVPDPGRVVRRWEQAAGAEPDVQAVLGFDVQGHGAHLRARPSGADRVGVPPPAGPPVSSAAAFDLFVAGVQALPRRSP
jgi:AcrR family transcriptional regulator